MEKRRILVQLSDCKMVPPYLSKVHIYHPAFINLISLFHITTAENTISSHIVIAHNTISMHIVTAFKPILMHIVTVQNPFSMHIVNTHIILCFTINHEQLRTLARADNPEHRGLPRFAQFAGSNCCTKYDYLLTFVHFCVGDSTQLACGSPGP